MLTALIPMMHVLGPAALLLVMVVVFAETGLLAGFFLPGDSILFLAGALVASGALQVPIWLVALGVFVAAVGGDQFGYLLGRRYGPKLFARAESRLFAPAHVARAAAFYERFGSKAVVFGRFIPVVRTFVPVTAGIGKMSHRDFTSYNIFGAMFWAIGIVFAGFFLGGISAVAAHVEIFFLGVIGVSLLPALISLLRKRIRSLDYSRALRPTEVMPQLVRH